MTISEIMFLVSNSILSLVTVKSLASNCTLLGLYLRLKNYSTMDTGSRPSVPNDQNNFIFVSKFRHKFYLS